MKLIFLISLLALSCTHHVSEQGRQVRIVTAAQKEKYCEYLDIVTVSSNSGWDSAHNRSNTINQVRNDVARLGGNGMYIITNANDNEGYVMSGGIMAAASTAVIQAEALSCNFDSKIAKSSPKKVEPKVASNPVVKKNSKKTVELKDDECLRSSDCNSGFSCVPVRGSLPGICTESTNSRSSASEGCMKDSDCGSGRVCATVRGEYPGSCAKGGFGF